MSVITDIIQYLSKQGIVQYSPTGGDNNIFMGRLPAEPSSAIAINPSGGYGASIKHDYDSPTIQILVRGTGDPRVGYDKALQIYDALHGFGGGSFVEGGYWIVKCEGIQSEPVYLGEDDNGRHMYTLNFALEVKRPSSHRKFE
ncbi:MAG: minor capsid protein [Sphaerochaetaceae bacterium]